MAVSIGLAMRKLKVNGGTNHVANVSAKMVLQYALYPDVIHLQVIRVSSLKTPTLAVQRTTVLTVFELFFLTFSCSCATSLFSVWRGCGRKRLRRRGLPCTTVRTVV